MKPLLVDFIRRSWWVLLGCLVASALSVAAGSPLIIAPAAAVLLLMDANHGWTRTVRCLPLRLQDQVQFCWVAGVLLIPMSSAVVMDVCAVVRAVLFPGAPSIRFGMAVQFWVGLGYSALCLCIVSNLSSRPGTNWREQVKAGVFGLMWGLSLAGTGALLPHLPNQPQQLVAWHWVVLVLSPIAVLASFPAARQLVRSRSTPPPCLSAPEVTQHRVSSPSGRLQGIPLFLATVPGRVVAMTALIYLIQAFFLTSIHDSGRLTMPLLAALQAVAVGVGFASLTVGWSGIRALRVLPLRTWQLAVLVLTPTLGVAGMALLIGAFSNTFGSLHLHPLDPVLGAVGVLGIGALGVAAILRFGKYGLLLPITIAAGLPAAAWIVGVYKIPLRAIIAPGGILLVLFGYLAVVRLLRQRSESYREIRFKGNPWQAQNS